MPQFDGLRILIVDDDRESCEMMLEALRRYGASVQCALSATEATATLLEFRPDLVLSDIAMPGRDGYAVLSEVRQVETALGRRVPVAAVSAYAHAEDRQRAIAAGFDQYLAKPVDPAALASTVKALVADAAGMGTPYCTRSVDEKRRSDGACRSPPFQPTPMRGSPAGHHGRLRSIFGQAGQSRGTCLDGQGTEWPFGIANSASEDDGWQRRQRRKPRIGAKRRSTASGR